MNAGKTIRKEINITIGLLAFLSRSVNISSSKLTPKTHHKRPVSRSLVDSVEKR